MIGWNLFRFWGSPRVILFFSCFLFGMVSKIKNFQNFLNCRCLWYRIEGFAEAVRWTPTAFVVNLWQIRITRLGMIVSMKIYFHTESWLPWDLGRCFEYEVQNGLKSMQNCFFVKYLMIPKHRLAKSGDAPNWSEFVIIYFLTFFSRLQEYDQDQYKTSPNCSRCLSERHELRYGQWLSKLNFKL